MFNVLDPTNPKMRRERVAYLTYTTCYKDTL